MKRTQNGNAEPPSDERPDIGTYLPAMPRLSSEPGRVERFLTNLFRRRGGLRVVLRNERR